ncbi:MAG: rRNA maturation RNase YbeY [Alphaproteobacteria bacterium]
MIVIKKNSRARLSLEFVPLSPLWRGQKKLETALLPALPPIAASAKLPPGSYVIAVALTDDKHQAELNHQFRGIAKSTNVLSFPQFTKPELGRLKPDKEPIFLGDISLSYQYIVGEANREHKILINHKIHLVIHGILHILGYDHRTLRQTAAMEKLERDILAAMKIPDPYTPPCDSGGR